MNELVKLSAARRAVAEARSVDELKNIRNQAEAIRYAAIQAGMGLDIINDAAEIKLRAERKAGGLLAEMEKQHGARDGKTGLQSVTPLKLEDVGVTKGESHRWQAIAAVPQEAFDEQIENIKAASERLTTASQPSTLRAEQSPWQGHLTFTQLKNYSGPRLWKKCSANYLLAGHCMCVAARANSETFALICTNRMPIFAPTPQISRCPTKVLIPFYAIRLTTGSFNGITTCYLNLRDWHARGLSSSTGLSLPTQTAGFTRRIVSNSLKSTSGNRAPISGAPN